MFGVSLKFHQKKNINDTVERLNIIKETLNNEITKEAELVINKMKNLQSKTI